MKRLILVVAIFAGLIGAMGCSKVLAGPFDTGESAAAAALIHKMALTMSSMTSFSGQTVFQLKNGKAREITAFQLERPNLMRITLALSKMSDTTKRWDAQSPFMMSVSNGAHQWRVSMLDGKTEYQDSGVNSNGSNLSMLHASVADFFDQSQSYEATIATARKEGVLTSLQVVGKARWENEPYTVLLLREECNDGGEIHVSDYMYVGRDYLVHRVVHYKRVDDGPTTRTVSWLENVVVNGSIPNDIFAYQLPENAVSEDEHQYDPKMLPVGMTAPAFTVTDRNGQRVSLSQYAGKVVVLDFWATWCGNCISELPMLNRVAHSYEGTGVTFLEANIHDTKAAFQKWVLTNSQFDSLVFAIDPTRNGKDFGTTKYEVVGLPTLYVIDRNGRIAGNFFGAPEAEKDLRAVIEKALANPVSATSDVQQN